jgi:hypothetical protein
MYIGNCTNLFDENGDCLLHFFKDVSEFAQREADISEDINNGRDILLSQEEFESVGEVDLKAIGKDSLKDFLFYFYPETETSPQVYVAYDELEDIHYFFA